MITVLSVLSNPFECAWQKVPRITNITKAVAVDYALQDWSRMPGHVTDGGTPGSKMLCELSRDFKSVLSPSCVAENSRSGEGHHAYPDRGCPRLQLASGSPTPRARRGGQKYVLDKFTVRTFCSIAKPAQPNFR